MSSQEQIIPAHSLLPDVTNLTMICSQLEYGQHPTQVGFRPYPGRLEDQFIYQLGVTFLFISDKNEPLQPGQNRTFYYQTGLNTTFCDLEYFQDPHIGVHVGREKVQPQKTPKLDLTTASSVGA